MSVPQTNIKLCKGVRLTNRYDHTIYFETPAAQRSYFSGKVDHYVNGYVYVRKNWSLQVGATMGQASKWSYLWFTNPDDSRIYYYFITDVQYVNDSTVELYVELDVLQTYTFEWTLLSPMVEREHSVTDAWAENTVDEGLDTGEYISGNITHTIDIKAMCIMVMTTVNLNNINDKVLGRNLEGCFSGMTVYAVAMEHWEVLAEKLKELDDAGKADAVVNMWMYPKNMVILRDNAAWDSGTNIHEVFTRRSPTYNVELPTDVNGYTPKNNKLFQYPYSLLYVTNNAGETANYRYEYFNIGQAKPDQVAFGGTGTVAPDAAVKIYPLHYKGLTTNYDEGLTLASYPTCAWNSDVYKLWLAQNQGSQTVSALTSVGQVIAGAAMLAATPATGGLSTAAGTGLIVSGFTSAMQQSAQMKDMQTQPPASKGTHSATLNLIAGYQCFSFIRKSVDAYHARRIDEFFTMYGYKTMRVKTPNLNSRPHFNYIKTIGDTVAADIPRADLLKINDLFNRGLTFWKNGDEIGDYSVDNRPE